MDVFSPIKKWSKWQNYIKFIFKRDVQLENVKMVKTDVIMHISNLSVFNYLKLNVWQSYIILDDRVWKVCVTLRVDFECIRLDPVWVQLFSVRQIMILVYKEMYYWVIIKLYVWCDEGGCKSYLFGSWFYNTTTGYPNQDIHT